MSQSMSKLITSITNGIRESNLSDDARIYKMDRLRNALLTINKDWIPWSILKSPKIYSTGNEFNGNYFESLNPYKIRFASKTFAEYKKSEALMNISSVNLGTEPHQIISLAKKTYKDSQ